MAEAQQGLKDRDLQRYYESMLALFTTPGWTYMLEDLRKLLDAANTLAGIKTQSDLDFRLGQIDILAKVIAQPEVISEAYDLLLEEDNEPTAI